MIMKLRMPQAESEVYEQSAVSFSSDLVRLKPSEEEEKAHLDYLQLINKKSNNQCLWTKNYDAEKVH